jgi:nucleoside 2-deoxyribosyltransferase
MMNIYFACSITGGREDEAAYQKIVDFLQKNGHEVPTASLAGPEVIYEEVIIDPITVYDRDTAWIRGCDLVVAEVTTPSHGVGYEIGYALQLKKPVICLHQADTPVSKMILGNQDPNLSIIPYKSVEEALKSLQTRLDRYL